MTSNRRPQIKPTAAEIRQAWLTIKEKAAAGDVAACIGLIQLSQDQAEPVSELAQAGQQMLDANAELREVVAEIIEALNK